MLKSRVMDMTPERKKLLLKKSQDYVLSFEKKGAGIDFDDLPTDTLLILQAFNDWTGGAFAEGGDLRLVSGGDDPACATAKELTELVKRAQRSPAALYPVSGFSLSPEDALWITFGTATYRLNFHSDGSRASAIGIAEAKRVADVDTAMQLWVLCATEDCMTYLDHQAGIHDLYLDDESQAAARRIIGGHLQRQFSMGQIWNATWRSVKDAAALSKHRYWNGEKASKQIPKKIDKVLLEAGTASDLFISYDRIEDLPPAAVLTLFRHRFGVGDNSPGPAVRASLEADHALAPPEEDDDFGLGEAAQLTRGVFFFKERVTELDRLVLASFDGIELDGEEPDWDDDHSLGELSYRMEKLRCFNGRNFASKLLPMLGGAPPTEEEIQTMAVAAQKYAEESGRWADKSGYHWAYMNALESAGVGQDASWRVAYVFLNPAAPNDVLEILEYLPADRGLVGGRTDSTEIYSSFAERTEIIRAAGYSFKISSEGLEPDGSDTELVSSLLSNDLERVAHLVGDSVWYSMTGPNLTKKAELAKLIADRLNVLAAKQGPGSDDSADV